MAAIPALLVAGAALYYLGRWVTPTPPDPRWEALPVRMAMVGAERALDRLAAAQEAGEGGGGEVRPAALALEEQGLFVYRLAVVSLGWLRRGLGVVGPLGSGACCPCVRQACQPRQPGLLRAADSLCARRRRTRRRGSCSGGTGGSSRAPAAGAGPPTSGEALATPDAQAADKLGT